MERASIRIDLHCHSIASNRPAEAALRFINCPECYSEVEAVYGQAKGRGMRFVTITDHDCIDGVLSIAEREDVVVGEEVTCFFPEDGCKMHVVVWGIDRGDHAALQRKARDIYAVAEYLEERRIAHAVAHPIYRQNERLERWHLERLLLMFKGFECLNGAHSPLHREAFEPLLDELDVRKIEALSRRHRLEPRWPAPWIKARTGGSDDHGLLNVGRTWTEFTGSATSVDAVLECLREGRCRPGGESGSSLKLAHTFYSVAVRYYGRHIMPEGAKANAATGILQAMVGERAVPTRAEMLRHRVKGMMKRALSAVTPPIFWRKEKTAPTIRELFLASLMKHGTKHEALTGAMNQGQAPLGEHRGMFDLVSAVNRDVSEAIALGIEQSIDRASFTGLFNAISGAMAQQFVLLPYYFALFHQNKERHLLRRLTGQGRRIDGSTIHVGLFTDTLEEMNGVSRFLRDMAGRARGSGVKLTIHTCGEARDGAEVAGRMNFRPLLSRAMPFYESLKLNIPPVIEVLEWAERQRFDVIHISTPGPMGLCGWLAAKMLRVPLAGTYHTDFPAYLECLTGDHRMARGAGAYMRWMYGQMNGVFARSRQYRASLMEMGVESGKLFLIPAAVDTGKFSPAARDEGIWKWFGVLSKRKLLYAGRVSVEKDLPRLVGMFEELWQSRKDVALVVAGDGPYRKEMEQSLRALPAHFLGVCDDATLAGLYASADLLVFPSRTDTLGQVVMEAQACGLPAIVSEMGGPREIVADGVSGVVMQSDSIAAWVREIGRLLDDDERRGEMSRAAAMRGQRWNLDRTFEAFWEEHVRLVRDGEGVDENAEHAVTAVRDS